MKVINAVKATLAVVFALLTVSATQAQTKITTDPLIFNIPQPPLLPDPNIVCTYAALDAPTVMSAIRLGDYYTGQTLGSPYIAAKDYLTADILQLAYLGYIQREMNFISTCLKNEGQTNTLTGTEPSSATPPTVDTGSVESNWFAPDDDGYQYSNLVKFFALPTEASPAVTQAEFYDFLYNRLLEDLSHYDTTYGYVVHPVDLKNNQGGSLTSPVF